MYMDVISLVKSPKVILTCYIDSDIPENQEYDMPFFQCSGVSPVILTVISLKRRDITLDIPCLSLIHI